MGEIFSFALKMIDSVPLMDVCVLLGQRRPHSATEGATGPPRGALKFTCGAGVAQWLRADLGAKRSGFSSRQGQALGWGRRPVDASQVDVFLCRSLPSTVS